MKWINILQVYSKNLGDVYGRPQTAVIVVNKIGLTQISIILLIPSVVEIPRVKQEIA